MPLSHGSRGGEEEEEEELPAIGTGPVPSGRRERVPTRRVSTTRIAIRALTRRAMSVPGVGRIRLGPVIKSTYPLNRGYLCSRPTLGLKSRLSGRMEALPTEPSRSILLDNTV